MTSRLQSAVSTGDKSLLNSPRQIGNAQRSLDFSAEILPGSLNDDLPIRAAVSSSIRRSDRSREQIAESMTEALGTRVTAVMLNTYTAASGSANRLPAAWVRAFCDAAGSDLLLEVLAEAAGYRLIRGEEIELLELGREWLRQKRASQQVEMLEKRLSGVEL